jgi:uncharacterized protein
MFRIIILLMTILFCANLTFSQENKNINHTVIWQVTKVGEKDTSYLFGTYHAFSYHFFEYYPEIIEIIKKTKAVVTEFPFYKNIDPSFWYAPDSLLMRNFATKKQYKNICRFFKYTMHLEGPIFKNYGIYTLHEIYYYYIVINYLYKYYEIEPSVTLIDEYCAEKAHKNNIETYGLEDISVRNSYIESMGCNCKTPTPEHYKKAVYELDSLINEFRKNPKDCKPPDTTLIKNYFEMNLNYHLDTVPGESEELNVSKKRNLLWIGKIDSLFNDKSAFVVVGLYHLYYKFGLINLLRDLKYKVEPLKIINHNFELDKNRKYNF